MAITTRQARKLRPYAEAQRRWLRTRRTFPEASFPMPYRTHEVWLAIEFMMRGWAREVREMEREI